MIGKKKRLIRRLLKLRKRRDSRACHNKMVLHRVVRDVLNCVRATLYFFGSLTAVSYAAGRSVPSAMFVVKPAAYGGIAGRNGNSNKVQRDKKSATNHTGLYRAFQRRFSISNGPFSRKAVLNSAFLLLIMASRKLLN